MTACVYGMLILSLITLVFSRGFVFSANYLFIMIKCLMWLVASSKRQLSDFMFTTVIITALSHFVPQDGRTALMRASDKGHTDVIQPLLSVGAQVDQQDKVRHSISS